MTNAEIVQKLQDLGLHVIAHSWQKLTQDVQFKNSNVVDMRAYLPKVATLDEKV
jgi:hypothetical protein